MPQYYNLTNISNSANVHELFKNVSDMSDGWLGVGIMISLSVIIFLALKDYPYKEAFAASMFISTIIALLLRILGIVGDFTMFVYVILTAIAVISLIFNKG